MKKNLDRKSRVRLPLITLDTGRYSLCSTCAGILEQSMGARNRVLTESVTVVHIDCYKIPALDKKYGIFSTIYWG
jgi:hypothetical protein